MNTDANFVLSAAVKGAFVGSLIAGVVLFSSKNQKHKNEILMLEYRIDHLEKQIPRIEKK